MKKSFGKLVLACATIATLLVGTGHAKAGSITFYSNRADFETALAGPFTVETFTSSYHFPISTGVLNSSTNLNVTYGSPINPGDIQPGVTYSTTIGTSFFFNIDFDGNLFDGGFLDGFFDQTYANVLTTTFTGPVVGFGFDTNAFMGTSFSIDIKFSSDPDYNSPFNITGPGFFGFLSNSQDIASAQILSIGSNAFSFALDNFTFEANPASPVPEPSSFALLGLGGISLAIGAYRRRRVATI